MPCLRGGIFRIQDLGDVLSFNLRLDGVKVLGLVEGEQVELVVALGVHRRRVFTRPEA